MNKEHLKKEEDKIVKINDVGLANNITIKDAKEAKTNLENKIEGMREKIKEYNNKFERYRVLFKENKDDLFSYEKEIKEFRDKSKQFNAYLEKITNTIEDDDVYKNLTKIHLQLLTELQLAQIKSTRVHSRINKCKLEKSLEKIENIENKIKDSLKKTESVEKKSKTILRRTKKLKNNLKNVYSGVLTILGVFLSVFTLVSVNINFFGNIAKELLKIPGYLDNLIKILVMVNATTIVSVTFLVSLSNKFIFSATQIEKENSNKCFVTILVFAFIFLMISLLCLHY